MKVNKTTNNGLFSFVLT